MGKRGAPPAPTALKLVRGDRPSRVNEDEPTPDERVCPSAPSWLPVEAKALWKRLAPDLHAKGVLTWWDRDEFAVLMEAFAVHRWASVEITKDTILVTGDKGARVKNPALQAQRDAASTITSFGGRFGLSPSDRQNLKLGGADDDEARRFLS